ncbi:MAG: trimethylamine methyltransferase [Tateyamaria sp.]|jgi:trimethylamine--corrinoid protein Co-methyltransferase|nr:trimethylamine methyltransferase [Tateyamaria sp.]
MVNINENPPKRSRFGNRRQRIERSQDESKTRILPMSGRLNPLTEDNLSRIHETSLEILERVGLSDAPASMIKLVTSNGGSLNDEGRLCFPALLVEKMLAELRRNFTLFGRGGDNDLYLTGAKVHVGTGGASPKIMDFQDGSYRTAVLADLYDAARLVDSLNHIHFFSRSMIASDLENLRDLDINTVFASLAGTQKHVMVSASHPAHVRDIADMCYLVAGSEGAFRTKPFLSLNINHVVPPLRFDPDACEVIAEAVKVGIPVMVNTFGQMGASSPVTIAGCLAQTNAETLAGMVFVWALNANAPAIYGARPMVTDLRSGGMAGGGGEQAMLTAAAAQIARYYGLPNSTIAGATDSKLADAQSGFEKALTVTTAAQAGANLITQAAGTQAGLLATSFEAYVIDNDMLGAILKSCGEIEIGDETLSVETVAQVVRGEGHFLGHPETYARMKSDFIYPVHADRQAPEAWLASGAQSINVSARKTVEQTLANHYPKYFSNQTDKEIRSKFDIYLPKSRMQSK